MSFTKITQAELNSRGATTLPNTPSIGATALKQEFDAPAKNIVAPKVNNLIDELESTTAAASLGASAPTGRSGATVQAVLNDLSSDLDVVEMSAHTHLNKTTCLDNLSDNNGELNYNGQPIGGSNYTAGTGISISNNVISAPDAHSHSNKSLLDTYNQTNANLSDAVSKKHEHNNNLAELDKIGESGGKLTYDNEFVGGHGYKTVKVGNTNIVAGNEDTLTLVAGANVTLSANAVSKTITIESTGGGGGGGGDMYKATYDQNNNGIVDSAETLDGLTASVSELNYMAGVTSAVQTQINALSNAKADKSTTYTKTEVDGLIPTSLSDLSDDATHRLVTDSEKSGWDAKADTSDIPTALSELSDDSSHRLVTDAEKSGWDAKADSSSLDEWSAAKTLASGNTVTFTGLNDAYGYKLFCINDPNVTVSNVTKSGSGTSMSLVYTVAGSGLAVGVTQFKLRIIK